MICVGGPLDGVDAKVPDTAQWIGRNGMRAYRVLDIAIEDEHRLLVPLRVMGYVELTVTEVRKQARRAMLKARCGFAKNDHDFVKRERGEGEDNP